MKATRNVKGVLLFPGAGTSCEHPSLVNLATALQPLSVRRADFPYRKAGKRAPDRAPVLIDAVRAEATDLATSLKTKTGKLVLGGRSMGGRMCTMAAAAGSPGDTGEALPVAGLVLICYPLHPPGKPENLRVEHLPRLTVPCLFISGTRDAFGTPAELEQWTATIPGAVTHVWLEGKGHDLKGADTAIAAAVIDWLPTLG
ncbi:MAG: dienelactone hydrolase [Ilumatobacteraceae bacterium]|nr:dienelactone hydrolase [Ilumatobacteraceae bacterium]